MKPDGLGDRATPVGHSNWEKGIREYSPRGAGGVGHQGTRVRSGHPFLRDLLTEARGWYSGESESCQSDANQICWVVFFKMGIAWGTQKSKKRGKQQNIKSIKHNVH